ncbi:MAG: FG-GAP repeat protein [Candidatus Sumerlaeia bacterium]|nr:FG-GAP repeat protein [Candidatus Sumerlaeia bacterium]
MSNLEFAHRAPVRCWVGLVLVLALGSFAPAQLTHPFRVDGLDGMNGVRLNVRGVPLGSSYQMLGRRLVGIGDINGDGFEDFAVSLKGQYTVGWSKIYVPIPIPQPTYYRGRVYVVLGRAAGWPQGVLSFGDPNASYGFQIDGRNRASDLGVSLSGAGDVNGDGYADFLVGAWGSSSSGDDYSVYLVLGRPDIAAPFSLDPLDGRNAVRFHSGGNSFGEACGGIGDVNGDGYDDFYIGNRHWSSSSPIIGMIVFGRPDRWPGEVRVFDLALGNGYVPVRAAGGSAVITGLGDVNGDSVDDFALAAPTINSTGGNGAGSVYVIYGRRERFGDELDLGALDGTNGFRLDGDVADSWFGNIVAIGDIDRDGISDVLAGAWRYPGGGNNRGQGSLILGNSTSAVNSIDSVVERSVCQFLGAGDASGAGYRGGFLGFSSDGLPSLVLGALSANSPPAPSQGTHGAAFIVRYNSDNIECPFVMSEFNETNGVRLDGAHYVGQDGGRFGEFLDSGFDFNGDGLPDAVISATDAYSREGEINLVYGFDGPTSLTLRRYVAPGNPPTAGVGMLGNGSHTIPHSRLWITFGSGDDGSGGASLVTVTVNRTADGLTNLPGPAAAVQWIGDWHRPGWDGAYITVKYLDSEVAGLAPTRLRLYYSETPDGPWTQSEHGFVDTRRKRVGGVVWSTGYYVLVEKSPPTGDVNRDGVVTPLDAQWAFECAIGACPPDADTEAADLCPPYNAVTPGDVQGIFNRFIGLTGCF